MDKLAFSKTSAGHPKAAAGGLRRASQWIRSPLQILLLSLWGLLGGCTAFGQPEITLTPTQNITQAYQTVSANLTAAIARTPTITLTPTLDPDATPTPTLTPTITPTPTPTLAEHTLTPTPPCDRAAPGTPLDLTIPDDTRLAPGEPFTKEWGLVNTGSCTWTSKYSLVWISGDLLSAPATVSMPPRTSPGESATVAVEMVAPAAPGTYQSNWKLRNPTGLIFGLGPAGEAAIWVRIIVDGTAPATASPTLPPGTNPAPSPTPDPGAAGAITLRLGEGIDLDAAPGGGTGTPDLVYDRISGGSSWLIPQPGVLLSLMGGIEPGLESCLAAPLSDAPIPLDSLSLGFYLCYQTDLGQPGRVRLRGYDPDALIVDLEYLTWAP